MKYWPLLIFSLTFATSVDSQEDKAIIPIHYIKVDVIKSAFSQLHVSYERYNGKKSGWEIGFGLYYPNHAMAHVFHKVLDFQVRGYEADLQRKFYNRSSGFRLYFSPMLRYAYKYWDNAELLESGPAASSFASWNHLTGHSHNTCLIAMFGFVPYTGKRLNIDVHIGLGGKYEEMNEIVTPERYSTTIESGHSIYWGPVLNAGITLGFALN